MSSYFVLYMNQHPLGVFGSLIEAKEEKKRILQVFKDVKCEDCRRIKLTIKQKIEKGV